MVGNVNELRWTAHYVNDIWIIQGQQTRAYSVNWIALLIFVFSECENLTTSTKSQKKKKVQNCFKMHEIFFDSFLYNFSLQKTGKSLVHFTVNYYTVECPCVCLIFSFIFQKSIRLKS
jgi:hypothetical protein